MDVTRVREQRHGRRVSNPRRDKRKFSRTAGSQHTANANNGRPMRGGIRL